jgi:hypothetical protein
MVPAWSWLCLRPVLGAISGAGFHGPPERLELVAVVFLGLSFLGVAGSIGASSSIAIGHTERSNVTSLS